MCNPALRGDCACDPTTDKDSRTMQCASWCTKESHCKQVDTHAEQPVPATHTLDSLGVVPQCKCAACPHCVKRTLTPRAPPQQQPPPLACPPLREQLARPRTFPLPPLPQPSPPEEAWSPAPSPPRSRISPPPPPSAVVDTQYFEHQKGSREDYATSWSHPQASANSQPALATESSLLEDAQALLALAILAATMLAVTVCIVRASLHKCLHASRQVGRPERSNRREGEGRRAKRALGPDRCSGSHSIPVLLQVEGSHPLKLGNYENDVAAELRPHRLKTEVLQMVLEHDDEILTDEPLRAPQLLIEPRNRHGRPLAYRSAGPLSKDVSLIHVRIKQSHGVS